MTQDFDHLYDIATSSRERDDQLVRYLATLDARISDLSKALLVCAERMDELEMALGRVKE